METILPVVICGGSGSRLWPLSRATHPKQFLSLTSESSLLQMTLDRISFLSQAPMLVCNQEHRFMVAEQLRAHGTSASHVLLEPIQRNTAPAIALAAMKSQEQGEDPLLLILPSDHVMNDQAAFARAICHAAEFADNGMLMTFGITPSRAESGYGYIHVGLELGDNAHVIDQFIEKPGQHLADEYAQSDDYYWNSGIFMFRASSFLKELETYHEEIYAVCLEIMKTQREQSEYVYFDQSTFTLCPSQSIDFAVMECTFNAAMVPLDADWSDVGSWQALWEICDKDDRDNVIQGDALAYESNRCLVKSEHRLVSLVGVEDLVVVETRDAVMIAHKDNTQSIKKVTEQLEREGREEHITHRQVMRPWGKFDSIDKGERFQVKHITVMPGEKLSLQLHHHRAEHWIVVSGTAGVTCGDEIKLLSENQSVYIPIGVTHSLENPGKVPLELIEVQSGAYLGEDDIVRFEDRYHRV
ncbi:MAG: mannose-1-phosphate guanylyltransferase/mannose-6-phosphate isomerase [Cellvibrionaceae bacterium]